MRTEVHELHTNCRQVFHVRIWRYGSSYSNKQDKFTPSCRWKCVLDYHCSWTSDKCDISTKYWFHCDFSRCHL